MKSVDISLPEKKYPPKVKRSSFYIKTKQPIKRRGGLYFGMGAFLANEQSTNAASSNNADED